MYAEAQPGVTMFKSLLPIGTIVLVGNSKKQQEATRSRLQ